MQDEWTNALRVTKMPCLFEICVPPSETRIKKENCDQYKKESIAK